MRRWLAYFGLGDAPEADDVSVTPPSASTLGNSITIKGELRGEGPLTVLGQFEGDIVLDGTLSVGPDARVDANISARLIVVAGAVHGNLSADTRVEILPSGSLTGTVKSSSFTAADGATVKGEIWVERSTRTPETHA